MKKKLTLTTETVRNLEDSDVGTVVGGYSGSGLPPTSTSDTTIGTETSVHNSLPSVPSPPHSFGNTLPTPSLFCPPPTFSSSPSSIATSISDSLWHPR